MLSYSREVTSSSSSLYPQGQTWHTIHFQSTLLNNHKLWRQARKQPSLQNVCSLNCPEVATALLTLCFRHLLFPSAVESAWPLMSGWSTALFTISVTSSKIPAHVEGHWKCLPSAWPIVNASGAASQASLHIAIIWEAPATTVGHSP